MQKSTRKRNWLAIPLSIGLAVASMNFVCTPQQQSWATVAEGIAAAVATAGGAAVDIADPVAAPLVSAAEAAFSTILQSIKTYQSSPSTSTLAAVSQAVTTADSNVASLEVAVKNPKTSATITGLAGIFADALAEIVAAMPTSSTSQFPSHFGLNAGLKPELAGLAPDIVPPAKPALKSHGEAKGLKGKDFKKQIKALEKSHKKEKAKNR